jgi:hypothetical protein
MADEDSRLRTNLLRKLAFLPFFVHVKTSNRARASINIFVGAPNGEISAPIMQSEGYIPYGMGEVPAAYRPLLGSQSVKGV